MATSKHESLINTFYQAFSDKDAEKMIACYHDDIVFTDPAFGTLKGERAKMMWKMLIERGGEGMQLEFKDIYEKNDRAYAFWEAQYQYGPKKRAVHNKINASFRFSDGKIIEHIDQFNLRNWAKQALGFKGFLLGGTSFFQKKMHGTTNKLLDRYIDKSA